MVLDQVLDKAASGHSMGGTEEFLSNVEATPTDYRCPRCRLHTLLSRTHDEIELDWCETCRGLFLDHDEVDALIRWRKSRVSEDRKKTARTLPKAALEVLADVLLPPS
jgi:Zn-finger nucleic acid-binding protein